MTAALATSPSPAASRDAAAVALVDFGLSRAAHREFFTNDEATQLLTDVRDGVGDVARSAAVASVVNDAVVSYGKDRLIGRRRVVDPLLDIRLALTHPNACDEAADVHFTR
jgi:hypothetical protein